MCPPLYRTRLDPVRHGSTRLWQRTCHVGKPILRDLLMWKTCQVLGLGGFGAKSDVVRRCDLRAWL